MLEVPAHVSREPEVAEVAGRQEHVGLEVISEASHLRPKGQRGIEVEAGGPEEAAAEAAALRAWSDTSSVETPDIQRST